MSLPPSPTPLEHLGNRPFSFYPAILNVEHNEWFFRRTTRSETNRPSRRCTSRKVTWLAAPHMDRNALADAQVKAAATAA